MCVCVVCEDIFIEDSCIVISVMTEKDEKQIFFGQEKVYHYRII